MTQTKSRFIIYNNSTIFEPDYSEENRPRKRARLEDSRDETGIFRDFKYYDSRLTDASASVILAGDTLFRVQKDKLTKASFFFHDLLEGAKTSDDKPVSLECEPGKLRAFLWALHASPSELKQLIKDIPQLEFRCSIALFSYSYNCTDQLSLALAAISNAVNDDTFFGSCSSSTLHLLVETAATCADSTLLNTILAKWIRRLERHESPCVPAIISANSLSIAELYGIASYLHLQEVSERSITSSDSDEGWTSFHFDPKLDLTQKASLLAGYWSLVNYWERIRRNPSKFVSCEHADCLEIWERRWGAAVGSRKVFYTTQADVLGLMRIMQELLTADDELKLMSEKCREKALRLTGKVRDELKENLGNHFTLSL